MLQILQSESYADWFKRLRDDGAKTRTMLRIRRLSLGLFGDAKAVGAGVSELRLDYGPGYRVYFIRKGESVIILLAGGDKRSQVRDIQRAIALAKTI